MEGRDPNHDEQEQEDFTIIYDNESANSPIVWSTENMQRYGTYLTGPPTPQPTYAAAALPPENAPPYLELIHPDKYIKFQ